MKCQVGNAAKKFEGGTIYDQETMTAIRYMNTLSNLHHSTMNRII
jgi:hypothetical protein